MPPDPPRDRETPSPGDAGEVSDIELMAAVKAGDPSALAELYDRHARHVYTVARRILGAGGEAEAVVSDVFLEVWTGAGSFDASRGACRTYLVVMARSRSIDRLRALRLYRDHVESAASSPPRVASHGEEGPGDDLLRAEERELVGDAIESLTDKQSQAIKLAFFRGHTHQEIADQLDEPLGTVKSRIRSGLKALRTRLSKLRGDGHDR